MIFIRLTSIFWCLSQSKGFDLLGSYALSDVSGLRFQVTICVVNMKGKLCFFFEGGIMGNVIVSFLGDMATRYIIPL